MSVVDILEFVEEGSIWKGDRTAQKEPRLPRTSQS